MSKRRKPGEVVRRKAGSGFCGSEEPQLVRVPEGTAYESENFMDKEGKRGEAEQCFCDDPECRSWANLEIVSGPHKGSYMYHISECEMLDR